MKALNSFFLRLKSTSCLTNSFLNTKKSTLVEVIKSETPLISHSLIRMPPPGIYEWAHFYFPKEEKMTIPVFDLTTNSFSGENVVLDQEIFNQTIRKDIIHKVLLFNKAYNRKTYKWVMSKGDVSGSNRKPFKQKKTGRAPQGDIRAPNLYHGGRAHGARPRDYYFPLNKKIRLMGLKSVLTSKFLENNIIVINSEKLEQNRPNILDDYLKFLRENRTLVITSKEHCKNFAIACKQLPYLKHGEIDTINVSKILENKIVMFTKDGLSEFTELLKERRVNYFRNRKIPLNPESKKIELPTDKFKYDFDPSLPLEIHTPALRGSLNKIVSHLKDPQKLKTQILEQRESKQKELLRLKEEKKQKTVESMYADDTAMENRRLQLRKERKLKLLKETRRLSIKKKKAAAKVSVTAEKAKK